MHDALRKIIRLLHKTGERCIVLDENGEAGFMIMSLDDYEHLLGAHSSVRDLTEEELLEKINRDIAHWRAGREEEEAEFDWEMEDTLKKNTESGQKSGEFFEERSEEKDEDTFYFEPLD